ncbi:hypothetical protein [Pseudophaeobacter sp.]|uniref:hypothetical protein n=1 Tax=Pseudophaeobacter sp. TaxID=1971739 RepID=UPI003298FBE5
MTYKTLHAQLRNNRSIPFETVHNLSLALSISLDSLIAGKSDVIGLAPQNQMDAPQAKQHSQKLRRAHSEMVRHGRPPDCNDILNWLRSNGGKINFESPISSYVDLFHQVSVTDGLMRPQRVGQTSLASLWIGIGSTAEYEYKVGQFPRSVIDASLLAHMRVQEVNRYSVEDVTVHGSVYGTQEAESYRRIIAPVKDSQGRDFNLVFAELLPTIT